MADQTKVLYEHTVTYKNYRVHTFATYIWEAENLVKIIEETNDSNGRQDYTEQTHGFGYWLNSITPEEFITDKGIEAKFI